MLAPRGLIFGAILWLFCAVALSCQTFNPPRTPDGHPDFQGIWNSATATPMERPRPFGNRAFFTDAEAHRWENQTVEGEKEGSRQPPGKGVGTYNDSFWEFGSKVEPTKRNSIVVDPPDGRIPALTPAAANAEARREAHDSLPPAGAEDLSLGSRCLAFSTAETPMTPYNYNSNYNIIQTPDYIAIYTEMIHDTRVIPLTPRPHPPENVRLWFGDSVGRWEGDTLVVDTTNFTDKTTFYGSDRNMHVTERFRWYGPKTLLYEFEIDDPTAFTRPWKGELEMIAASGPIYEYACHEGNYALPDLLRGARHQEAQGRN